MRKEAKTALAAVVNIFVILFLIVIVLFSVSIRASNSGTSQNASLTVYDDTLPDTQGAGENRLSNMIISFYANYTNSTNSPINLSNGNGLCQVAFNFSGTYTALTNMTFNLTNYLWTYNWSFNYKGNHFFNTTCTSTFGNVSLIDNFTVTNTPAKINLDIAESYVDLDNNRFNDDKYSCSEDTIFIYNITANTTEPDVNDVLTFNYTASSNTTLANFTINSSSGLLTINVTNDATTGLVRLA